MALFSPYTVLFRGKRALFIFMIREVFYNGHFGIKRDVIGPENTYFLNVKLYFSIS